VQTNTETPSGNGNPEWCERVARGPDRKEVFTMTEVSIVDRETVEELCSVIAGKVMMPDNMVLPFVDFTGFMAELFMLCEQGEASVIMGGYASPDVAIAADRAQLQLNEVLGISPFTGDPESVLRELVTGRETVCLANPNRVTGANFGLADLRMIARAVSEGTFIVDEHYFDFYGISALPLMDEFDNLVIIRPLATPSGMSSDECGFAVAKTEKIEELRRRCQWNRISRTLHKILSTALSNHEAMSVRLKSVHDESLKIAGALAKLGIQTRINATDFLLLRVAEPKRVGRFLSGRGIQVVNLDKNPDLTGYLRYQICTPRKRDALLRAFETMPPEYYKLPSADQRKLRLHRPGQTADMDKSDVLGPAFGRRHAEPQTESAVGDHV
jgi:histidinol-phosphate aminotransferase